MNCSTCTNPVNEGARFCSACGTPVYQQSVAQPPTRLVRAREGKVIAGVCAGVARAYGWDVIAVRLILAAVVVFGCGFPVLLYVVAWIVMPQEPFVFFGNGAGPAGTVPPGTQPVA